MGIKHDGTPLASEFASAMAVSAIKLNEVASQVEFFVAV
jgi:hypothetical protein